MSLSLRQHVLNEELDYLLLKDSLKDYEFPRAKITSLLKNKTLIRVKKGLYVFGEAWAQKPMVKEVLANLIYGPSYLSLEYALSFYGFIPERVETLTSVTNKRDKVFDTPVGRFTYRYIHPHKYPVGVTQITLDPTHSILIATPEKALADLLMLSPSKLALKNTQALKTFLLEDVRMDPSTLLTLNPELLNAIALCARNSNVTLLARLIANMRSPTS